MNSYHGVFAVIAEHCRFDCTVVRSVIARGQYEHQPIARKTLDVVVGNSRHDFGLAAAVFRRIYGAEWRSLTTAERIRGRFVTIVSTGLDTVVREPHDAKTIRIRLADATRGRGCHVHDLFLSAAGITDHSNVVIVEQ